MLTVLWNAGLAAAAGDMRVVEAVKKGDSATVLSLLQERVDVNAPEVDGTTALHWAVRRDDLETARLLIRSGANVKAANRYGVTPLAVACIGGSAAMITALLEAGADPNAAQPEGETALMTAARTGSVEAVKVLLGSGANVNAKENFLGQTALMWAVAQRHSAVARTLIERGADFRARSNGGFTALLFAARAGDLESVNVLVGAGANVNETTPDGTSVLNVAIANAHYELAAFLLDRGADPEIQGPSGAALHTLIRTRTPDFTTTPNPIPTGRLTSLDLAKALLARGADPNSRLKTEAKLTFFANLLGATPFALAARAVDVEIMRLLVANGADPLISTQENITPLMLAAGVGYNDGVSPGTEEESLAAVKLALELGGSVTAVSDLGDTALHGAALRGANSLVLFLVERGGRLDLKNNRGWLPLTMAEGVFLGTNVKAHDGTAALIRQLMKDGQVASPQGR
jgi:ankyrin repeat protein